MHCSYNVVNAGGGGDRQIDRYIEREGEGGIDGGEIENDKVEIDG